MQFYEDLAEQLARAEQRLADQSDAGARTEQPGARDAATRRRLVRPRLALASALVVAGALLAFVVISLSSNATRALAGLEILDTPSKDATRIKVPDATRKFGNLRSAHPFPMPGGQEGYVFLTRPEAGRAQKVCVASPEPAATPDDGYGIACRTKAAAEAKGLSTFWLADAPDTSLAIVVLPVGATVAKFRPKGKTTEQTVPSTNGVVVFAPPGYGMLSWTGGSSGRQKMWVQRNILTTSYMIDCGFGRPPLYLTDPDAGRYPMRMCRNRTKTQEAADRRRQARGRAEVKAEEAQEAKAKAKAKR